MCAVVGHVVSIRMVSAASIPVSESSSRITSGRVAGRLDDRFKSCACNRYTESGGAELRLPDVS